VFAVVIAICSGINFDQDSCQFYQPLRNCVTIYRQLIRDGVGLEVLVQYLVMAI